MSAIRLPSPNPNQGWRPLIVKLYHTNYSLDPFSDRLYSLGYTVLNTLDFKSTLKAVHEQLPSLVVVHDDVAAGVDALEWLAMQHTDRNPKLAMVPLIILADPSRIALFRPEMIADRVIPLQMRADTLNQLTRTVRRVLHVWGLDAPPGEA